MEITLGTQPIPDDMAEACAWLSAAERLGGAPGGVGLEQQLAAGDALDVLLEVLVPYEPIDTTKPAMPLAEVAGIASRDPDYECHIGVFVDGFQSDFAEFTVDPGAGDTRADWNESRQLDLEQVSERGPAVPGVGHRLRIRVVLHRG